jgi:MazG family protein
MTISTNKPSLLSVEEKKQIADAFISFVETVAWLRHPTEGCPWDVEQTHETLRRYVIEEAYEAAHAMTGTSTEHLVEELGDVLLQVVLNAQVAKDEKSFKVEDVIRGINHKMISRHPHVFAAKNAEIDTPEKVKIQWEQIKQTEKKKEASLIPDSKIDGFPAAIQAYKIGKLSAKVDFDWYDKDEVFKQFKSEVEELEEEISKKNHDVEAVKDEIGDVFFTLCQVCRHLGLDPEVTFQDSTIKFVKRFRTMEKIAADKGIDFANLKRDGKEELWNLAKKK